MDRAQVEACAAETLERTGAAGARLLLGVSGGSDSMALLGVLARLAAGRVAVAHVQHGLRAQADADAAFVASACAALDVPCRRIDAPPAPGEPRSETAARTRRLTALARAARDAGCAFVLLAQHAEDDVETTLLQLLRGHRGDRAWAGVPTLRPLAPGVQLLRPWLAGPRRVGRADLARAREALGLEHVDDASNRDPRVPRSALRLLLADAAGRRLAERVAAGQRRARARLERRLAAVTARLAVALAPHGRGCRLAATAFVPDAGDTTDAWDAELLRLLGGCLLRRRDVLRRDAARAAWRAALDDVGGRRALAAAPTALAARVTSDALLFADEPLAPGPGDARALRALLATPLFV